MHRFKPFLVVLSLLFAACGGPGANLATVEGVVTNEYGLPLPGIRVQVPGHEVVATDSEGRFTVAGVTPPYTLIVEKASSKYEVYEGIERTDPSVHILTGSGTAPFAAVRGTLQGTTSGRSLSLRYGSPRALSAVSDLVSAAPNTAYAHPVVLQSPSARGRLYALEWIKDAAGNADEFTSYAEYPESLDLEAGQTLNDVDFTLNPIADTHDLLVNVTGPPGFSVIKQKSSLRLDGVDGFALPIATFKDDSPTTNHFTVRSPNLAETATIPMVFAFSGTGAFAVWESVPSTSTTHALVIGASPEQLEPADGASLEADAAFRWQPHSEGVAIIVFDGDVDVRVFTEGSETRLPDLSGFGVSYGLDPYDWSVVVYSNSKNPEGDVDWLLEEGARSFDFELLLMFQGIPDSQSGSMAWSLDRSFTLP